VEWPVTDNGVFIARCTKRGYLVLKVYLESLGDLNTRPLKQELAGIIQEGRARWVQREKRDYGGVQAVADQLLREWMAALTGYPGWAIRAAFRHCNINAIHPPKPVEVSAACEEVWGEMGRHIRLALRSVEAIEERRPEWVGSQGSR
jgi:hypothetical protein